MVAPPQKRGAPMIIPAVLGVGVGVLVGRATRRCGSGGGPGLTQNAARTLLQAESAIDRFKPVLEPLSRGNTPSVRALIQVARG